jgi:hypothetical protein
MPTATCPLSSYYSQLLLAYSLTCQPFKYQNHSVRCTVQVASNEHVVPMLTRDGQQKSVSPSLYETIADLEAVVFLVSRDCLHQWGMVLHPNQLLMTEELT